MPKFLLCGKWSRAQIRSRHVPSSRRIVPEVEAIIDREWSEAKKHSGRMLFDGQASRLERFTVAGDQIEFDFSPTSYRIFWGTNLRNPSLADRFGQEVMGNIAGLSPSLLTRDQKLLFGKRSSRVAYYPSRVHPFAGSMEIGDIMDPVSGIERELHEELQLQPGEIESIELVGIAQDQSIRQCELIFAARSGLNAGEISQRLDRQEHDSLVAIDASRTGIEQAISLPELTPVAVATLALFGREAFGASWYVDQISKLRPDN